MARKRFSDLERISDAIRLAGANINTLPQNLDFVKYEKWKRGEGPEITITRPDLQGYALVGVKAFGEDGASDSAKKLVKMTTRAKTYFDGAGGVATRMGYTATITDYNEDAGFVPAQLRAGITQAGTAATSRITGRRYKKKISAGYTGPIGQGTTTNRYKEVIDAILAALPFTGTGATAIASFSPEEFRRD